jgi:hypothetical protein
VSVVAKPKTDWRAVADTLYARLMYHDYCDNGHASIDPECAFCRDRAACEFYRVAGGRVRTKSFADAISVSLVELMQEKGAL